MRRQADHDHGGGARTHHHGGAKWSCHSQLVDYIEARAAINGWVAEQTRDRIPELIPEGVLDELTRLVLTNVIYLKAPWQRPFDGGATAPAPFHRLEGASSRPS